MFRAVLNRTQSLVSKRLCSSLKDVRAARKAKVAAATAAATQAKPGSIIFRLGAGAVTALSVYAIYDIVNNPTGAIGKAYYGSFFYELIKPILNRTNEIFEPVSEKLLPDWPTAPCYGNVPPGTPAPPLLVIDLERTLIGSVYDPQYGWRHVKRPGVDAFINALHNYYELVIFSENDINLAAEILMAIDKDSKCHKLGAAAGEMRGTHILKRLDLMNRDLSRIILVDDDPDASQLFPRNTLLVKPFTNINDKNDTVLLDLIPLLQALVHEDCQDFRATIDNLGTHEAEEAAIEYRMRLARKKSAEEARRNKGLGVLIRGQPTAASMDDGSIYSSVPSPSQLVGAAPKEVTETVQMTALSNPVVAQALGKKAPTPSGERKKGKLFDWLDNAEKQKEEEERARREKMNEIYAQRMRAKAQAPGSSTDNSM